MPYWPYRRAALLIPFNEVPHLFVVLNDPDSDGQCLLVMVNSIKPHRPYDGACQLCVGDHAFIERDSYLNYRLAAPSPAGHIKKMVESGYYKKRDDFAEDVFKRICDGLYASDETRIAILKYAKKMQI
jgi:hypothetical protein